MNTATHKSWIRAPHRPTLTARLAVRVLRILAHAPRWLRPAVDPIEVAILRAVIRAERKRHGIRVEG